VRFNGKKAWIKLSKLYQNQQCGLCGHYDDNSDNDLRMGDNEETSDLERFHRSFSIPDSQECSTTEQDSFYSTHKAKGNFRREQGQNSGSGSNEQQQQSQWDSQEEEDQDREEMNDDSWWGPSSKASAAWVRQDQDQQQQGQGQRRQSRQIEPVKLTKVEERPHEICFSAEPVKQCPEGTTSADQAGNQGYSSEEQSGQQQGGQQQRGSTTKRVTFICKDRSTSEARQLQRQVRREGVVHINGQTPSFTKEVRVPGKCIRY
jgi:hypothetical protein